MSRRGLEGQTDLSKQTTWRVENDRFTSTPPGRTPLTWTVGRIGQGSWDGTFDSSPRGGHVDPFGNESQGREKDRSRSEADSGAEQKGFLPHLVPTQPPPRSAGTKARDTFRAHEANRMKERTKRLRQQNKERLLTHIAKLDGQVAQTNQMRAAAGVMSPRSLRQQQQQRRQQQLNQHQGGQQEREPGQTAGGGGLHHSPSIDHGLGGSNDLDVAVLANMMTKTSDQDGGGSLTVNELVVFMANTAFEPFLVWLLPPADGARGGGIAFGMQRFKRYDQDGSSSIERSELERAIRDYIDQEGGSSMVSMVEVHRSNQAAARQRKAARDLRDARLKHGHDKWMLKQRSEEELAARSAMAEGGEKLNEFRHRLLASAYQGVQGVDLREAFSRSDKDGSGTMDRYELKRMVRHVMRVPPIKITNAEVYALFDYLDADNSGCVDVGELVGFCEGTLDEQRIKREEVKRRPWGNCGDELPTPVHLLPTWRKPEVESEAVPYRPPTALVSLITTKPPRRKRPQPHVQYRRPVRTMAVGAEDESGGGGSYVSGRSGTRAVGPLVTETQGFVSPVKRPQPPPDHRPRGDSSSVEYGEGGSVSFAEDEYSQYAAGGPGGGGGGGGGSIGGGTGRDGGASLGDPSLGRGSVDESFASELSPRTKADMYESYGRREPRYVMGPRAWASPYSMI